MKIIVSILCRRNIWLISMWYDIENLEKLTTENASKENDDM